MDISYGSEVQLVEWRLIYGCSVLDCELRRLVQVDIQVLVIYSPSHLFLITILLFLCVYYLSGWADWGGHVLGDLLLLGSFRARWLA